MHLTQNDKNELLNIAEWAIQHYLRDGVRKFEEEKFALNDIICSKCGVFVSVYIKEELRGCMGTFSESDPLCRSVHYMALQAAFEDNRFETVQETELDFLHTEISALSPRKRIKDPNEIIIGKHGIYLIHGFRRATLLPQVAEKHHWNPIEFLECCAKNKLGLTKDSWKDAEIYTYEALVFS